MGVLSRTRPASSVLLVYAVFSIATARQASAQVVTYQDEASYLAAAAGLAYDNFQESFESSAAWGPTRFPNAAYSVSSMGIVWTANVSTNKLSTSNGSARTGSWGVFSTPHGITVGNLLDLQHDGFIATSSVTIYGVGGWFTSNTPGAQIEFMLDGKVVSFNNSQVTSQHTFFGVIDPGGFTTFEVYETEGKVEDQKLIFADDFVFCALAGSMPDGGSVLDGGVGDMLVTMDSTPPPADALPIQDGPWGPDQPVIDAGPDAALASDAGADATVASDAGPDASPEADTFRPPDARAADLSDRDTSPAVDHAAVEMSAGEVDAGGGTETTDGCSCDIGSEQRSVSWQWLLVLLILCALTGPVQRFVAARNKR